MWDVVLAVLPQTASVSIKNSGRVEVEAGEFLFIHWNDYGHAVPSSEFLYLADRGAIGYRFG